MKTNLRKLIAMTLATAMMTATVAFANPIDAIMVNIPDPATVDLMADMPAMNPEIIAPIDGGVEMPVVGEDGIALINNDLLMAGVPATNPDLIPPTEGGAEMPMLGDMFVAPYISQTGTVGMLTANEDGSMEVFLEDEMGGLRFMIAPETRIIDRATGEYIFAEDMAEGMTVTVIYSSLAPVGMSLPPFVGQVSGVIANADAGLVSVGTFNDELFSEDAMLQLNVDEENLLLTHFNGSRMMATLDQLKENGTAVVFYDMVTRSIPPQTTPTHIFLLEQEIVVPEEGADLGINPLVATSSVEGDIVNPETGLPEGWTPADGARPIAPEFVPVRDTAEALGYEVIWQGFDLPVIVKNDVVTFEITVGSATYLENGVEVIAPQVAENIDGSLFASINF